MNKKYIGVIGLSSAGLIGVVFFVLIGNLAITFEKDKAVWDENKNIQII